MFKIIFVFPLIISLCFGELKEQDAICGPGDSCYAVFYSRHTFLESWRACRERGGNLATVKNSQEAALVEQLLTSSASSRTGGFVSKQKFWIGLQRQPRQCAPQKPLRGFTWTTGDQDTAFTNWATQAISAGSPSSCSAPRCVAIGLGNDKPEDDFKWLEGSCTLHVEGFVCKYRYQGMCPALSESVVSYSAPFGYQGTWLDRVPFGTVAMVSCEGQPRDMSVLCMMKEDGTVGWNIDGPLCQPSFTRQCQGCQQLCGESGLCSCFEGYFLQPDGRSCEPVEEMSYDDPTTEQGCPCQYQCVGYIGMGKGYHCICPKGYQLANDGHHCVDIDECDEEEGPCDHACENIPGSYTCSCDLGFAISEDEPGHCVDVDECRIAHVCQQMCVNYDGGFECFCSEGYELDSDRVSCKPLRYSPNPPLTSSEEDVEDATYTDEDDSRFEDRLQPTWELAGTTYGGRREIWDSTDNTHIDDITASRDTIDIAQTTTSLETGWNVNKKLVIEPPMNDLVGTITSFEEWETEDYYLPSTTIQPLHKTSAPVNTDTEKESKLLTTFSRFILMSSTMAARISTDKAPAEKNNAITLSESKGTSEIPSTTEPEINKNPLDITERPIVDSKKDITNPNIDVLVLEDVLTTFSPEPPLHKDSKTVSPVHTSASPVQQESRVKRDNRWLIVALLVPLCVFLVIMLAMGIVYCTRCGGETKPRSVTDCYHWVTGGGPEKGLP